MNLFMSWRDSINGLLAPFDRHTFMPIVAIPFILSVLTLTLCHLVAVPKHDAPGFIIDGYIAYSEYPVSAAVSLMYDLFDLLDRLFNICKPLTIQPLFWVVTIVVWPVMRKWRAEPAHRVDSCRSELEAKRSLRQDFVIFLALVWELFLDIRPRAVPRHAFVSFVAVSTQLREFLIIKRIGSITST